jgi:hypothetical protein
MVCKTRLPRHREGNILDRFLVLVLGRLLSLITHADLLEVVPGHAPSPPPRSVGVAGSVLPYPAAVHLAIGGEHGIQVSILAKAILRLLPLPEARVVWLMVEEASPRLPA